MYFYLTKRPAAPKKIKLTYFNIAGVAEKLRLTLMYYGVEFEDERVEFKDWPELKKTMKYGQVPLLEVDGQALFQSSAMVRWAGEFLGDGKLYPAEPMARYKVEEMMGPADDITRSWTPCLYVAMRPENMGCAMAILVPICDLRPATCGLPPAACHLPPDAGGHTWM